MRVVSWNLWGRLGPWRERQPAIAATLSALAPDLVGLQECWITPQGSAVEQLAGELGMHWAVTDSRPAPGAAGAEPVGNANAILSRYSILTVRTVTLPFGPDPGEERWLLDVVVDGPAGPLRFATTHLNWRPEDGATRVVQAQAVAAALATPVMGSPYPEILCGDFNGGPDSDEYRLLTGAASHLPMACVFRNAWEIAGDGPGYSWSRENPHTASDAGPSRRLDHVFATWPVDSERGWVTAAGLAGQEPVAGMVPSDHYAVVVDFTD